MHIFTVATFAALLTTCAGAFLLQPTTANFKSAQAKTGAAARHRNEHDVAALASATHLLDGSRSLSASALMAAKNKKSNETKDKRGKIENPVELVLLYMTPWKNPNSIFVYLFAIVYVLGKYSESHSALR